MKILNKIGLICLCIMIASTSFIFGGCGSSSALVVNEVTHSIFYAPFYAAINLGYFEDEGITIELVNGGGSNVSMTALLSGSADIILAGPETVVYSESAQNSPVIFGQLTQKDGSFIVSKTQNDNFSINDLVDSTIIGGRAGGLPAMTLQYIIESNGLTIGTGSGEVNLRTDVPFDSTAAVFQTSDAQYCTLFEPNATNIQSSGNYYIVEAVGNLLTENVPYTCFITLSSYISDNEETCEKFLKAVMRGYEYIKNNSSEDAAKALSASFEGTSLSDLQIAVEQYLAIDAWCSSPVMSEESYQMLLTIINNYETLSSYPTYSQAVNTTIAEKVASAA